MKKAFYSQEQANKCGNCYYLKPDGTEVLVTEARDSDKGGSRFPDAIDLGEVVKWSRDGTIKMKRYGGA